jgi:ribonucleoside-diphosphate reductase alpha chain
MLLRHGVDIKQIIKTAKKVNPGITSFTSAIVRVLSKYTEAEVTSETCPECGEKLIRESGCISCKSCGYSKCG